ncbi:heterogeneous nuclear ribonucleoprotein U-like protein 2 isoform X2 [Aethina tumida]|uniref:heterogeneous nuclear ribonucleoprotein U-like protein 2 isoform X2 n=1 Tax=Aethina tumida TaxID=116153 RepID=UPI00096B0677|nr:heterogeneous nuclear ribonucleoprotein U-like protein 2 isoform X2 [Aethina tumida]
MSSQLDPAKLKVVELRSELAARKLDTKGNKAALVKRLQDALDAEQPDEGGNQSEVTETEAEPQNEVEAPSDKSEDVKNDVQTKMEVEQEVVEEKPEKPAVEQESPVKEKVEVKEEEKEVSAKEEKGEAAANEEKEEVALKEDKENVNENKSNEEVTESQDTSENDQVAQVEENGEKAHEEEKKSDEKMEDDSVPEETVEPETEKKPEETEKRGEKRRRSSPSPERAHQRKRSKSPIKEDEPILDNDKVQLSWYDSDLHLQLDKESFLSGRPFNEGAFGFVWAGVRTNCGVSDGKVRYEVKLTEELAWEDFSQQKKRSDRDSFKLDHRKSVTPKKTSKEADKKQDEPKSEPENTNGNADDEKPTETTDKVEEKPEEPAEHPEAMQNEEEKTEEKPSEEQTEVKEKEEKEEEPEKTVTIPVHVIRIGWSVIDADLMLGESKHSYGYESSGQFVTEKQFQDYAVKYAVGDVVGAYVNIGENIEITYTVNGVAQPTAVTVPKSDLPENFALFPHILSRNVAFEINVGQKEEPWFASPAELEDYVFLDRIENKVAGPQRPTDRSECEVILMCGLPACGKTHWVREHVKNNKEKRYHVIGNTQLLEKMTVCGAPLKSTFKGRWSLLMDRLQRGINHLLEVAPLRRRNYIIDQTNVFPSAQRRKLRPFEGFKRKAVVLVVTDEEQAKRQTLQEAQDGKEVPDNTILEMKAAMTLPEKGEWLDEVIFADIEEEKAKEMVAKYNKDGKSAGYGTGVKRTPRRDWHKHTRRTNHRDRNYHNRYDNRTPYRSNWNHRSSGPWDRDRRDSGRRDWRPRHEMRPYDRRDRQSSDSYNRRQSHDNRSGSRSSSSRGWQGYHHGSSSGGGGGGWNQQVFGQHSGSWGAGQQQGGGQGYNQWKYSGSGSGQGGYGSGSGGYGNWNYYGQYAQGWGSGQGGSSTPAQTQQNWAQYAQQYAQQNTPSYKHNK